ncbi:hypothetical protein Vadar_002320 [Vaccinium darrowii]|uniref:Uncharacterized protein n=1 Tax=Vaccinium darrowii TaxID=229202 RepID=A0ACB7Y4R5_9ERIC|nr:hypothetical protein Vadar_002320 [Vaccinium darrowii]
MWVKWFSYATLKKMDGDLAKESDSSHPRKRWLWPSTGEVFWQGIRKRCCAQEVVEGPRCDARKRSKVLLAEVEAENVHYAL